MKLLCHKNSSKWRFDEHFGQKAVTPHYITGSFTNQNKSSKHQWQLAKKWNFRVNSWSFSEQNHVSTYSRPTRRSVNLRFIFGFALQRSAQCQSSLQAMAEMCQSSNSRKKNEIFKGCESEKATLDQSWIPRR